MRGVQLAFDLERPLTFSILMAEAWLTEVGKFADLSSGRYVGTCGKFSYLTLTILKWTSFEQPLRAGSR